ncbi:MAG: cobalamin biosynthesis protein CobD [Verrucomicrobia bacterium]|nr:cobalamin biosynthesis protein CobD [Verrucomicrobiota bacterium]
MWLLNPSQIVAAIIVDLIIGDPQGWPHQARFAGVLSTAYERWLTRYFSRSVRSGLLFWFLVVGTMVVGYAIIRVICSLISPIASYAFDVFIIYQAIAARDLHKHAEMVLQALVSGDLGAARQRLSFIVGRDTRDLDASEISRATIESVSESLVDGIVAPLFWAVIGGAPGALIYRTANTLDSMVGHRTPAYEKFGKPSARIDDLLNWAPARLCALMICLFRVPTSWPKVQREAGAHASPNAGWPEAAMAYGLGVRLGGTNYYDGEAIEGPVFNASGRIAAICDIKNSLARIWWVVLAAGGVCFLLSICGSLSRRDVRTQPGVSTPGIDQRMTRPERAEDTRSTFCPSTRSSVTTFYRPFRAALFSARYPGLKPRAESFCPFGTETAMLLPPAIVS